MCKENLALRIVTLAAMADAAKMRIERQSYVRLTAAVSLDIGIKTATNGRPKEQHGFAKESR
jgi:hypothetical protein